jgi:hypothetical protein
MIYSTGEYKFHPLANAWPLLPPEELSAMAADIKKDGQKLLIWLHPDDNSIIDGRNRYMACLEAGVEPKFCIWNGEGELLDFLISLNDIRRHLTQSQKSMVGAKIEEHIAAEIAKTSKSEQVKAGIARSKHGDSVVTNSKEKGKARERAAKAADSSPSYVGRAKRLMKEAPEVAREVAEGKISIPAAEKKAGINRPGFREVPHYKPPGASGAGQSRVNGILMQDTPEVATMRAKGSIPKNAIPDVTIPEEGATAESIKESNEEEQAIKEEGMTEEEWLKTLPLSSQLKERSLATFQEDALAHYRLRDATKTFKAAVSYRLGRMKRKDGSWIKRIKYTLSIEGPEKWVLCPPTDQGGCNGQGNVKLIGECKKCFGTGYLILGGSR